MHPLLIIIPTAALVIGPRIWVNQVLRQYNQRQGTYPGTAAELARELLDQNQLQRVQVERTDLGDHYDPQTRTVRLARDKYDRNSLTAHTAAAHEVAHAIQHHANYGPFIWRIHLGRLAQVTGEAGFVLLLSAPFAAMFSRRSLPPFIIGTAALAMLGTGMAVQLVALPSELDASFRKALPMLEDGYIDVSQTGDTRKILTACSMTYVASSLVSVLHIWPWLGRGPGMAGLQPATSLVAGTPVPGKVSPRHCVPARKQHESVCRPAHTGSMHALLRTFAKPLIRHWMKNYRFL